MQFFQSHNFVLTNSDISQSLNMDDIYMKWLQIWMAMFFVYIVTVFLFIFYVHDLIYDAINFVRNMIKKK